MPDLVLRRLQDCEDLDGHYPADPSGQTPDEGLTVTLKQHNRGNGLNSAFVDFAAMSPQEYNNYYGDDDYFFLTCRSSIHVVDTGNSMLGRRVPCSQMRVGVIAEQSVGLRLCAMPNIEMRQARNLSAD